MVAYDTFTITEVQDISITSTSVTYQKGTSGTIKPTGTWLDTIPSIGEGEYLWTKTVVTYSDSSETESYSVSRNGKDGGRWYSGTKITGTSSTATVFSGSGITSAVVGDMYLNTTTYNTYQCTVGGSASVAKWVYVNNIRGGVGDTGKGISSIQNLYCLSSSNVEAIGTWDSTPQTYIEGKYYWTKSHIVWTDNTSTDTTPVLDNALTDANANAIGARKVATNYLSADTSGIMVANMENGEQTPSTATGRNVFIDNDSVDIRDGQNTLASFTGNNTKFYDIELSREVASFGTNGVRVGSEDEQHFIVDSESIQAINENGSSIFSVQSTGGTITTEIIVAKGGNSQPHTDWEVYLNGGSSVPQNTFYAKEYSLLIDIDNSINTFNSMTVSVDDGNFQNVPVVRTQYQNSTGMTVYSRHLVTLPPFSFQYGTEKTFKYQVEGVYISDKGNTYRYSSTIRIPYDGQRTITMEAVGGTLTQTSGSVSGDNTSVPYGGNSTIWGDIYSSLGYAKAPAMTFGTRGKAGIVAPLSVTIGEELYANNNNQLSVGRYNINNDDPSFAFVIGNGTNDNNRSDAFTVDWDGNIKIAGDLEVAGRLMNDRLGGNYLPFGTNIDNLSKYDTGWWVYARSDVSGTFPISDTYGTIGHIQGTSDNIAMQFLRSNSQAATSPVLYIRYKMGGTWGAWQSYVSATKTYLVITRTNNSYCNATDIGYLEAYKKGGYLSLRGNLHLSTSMPTGTENIQIATIANWKGTSGFLCVPAQTGNSTLVVSISESGTIIISNYSGVATSANWFRFSFTTPCNNGYE